jgi:L,D-transpeptidase ErfK/SrfK
MRLLIKVISIFAVLSSYNINTFANEYSMPYNSNIVGQSKYITVPTGLSLFKLGHKYDIGYHEMTEANPRVNPWRASGQKVLIPSRFVLPASKSYNGIIINLAELRLYFFDAKNNRVYTYPIGIGQIDWPTPTKKNARITKKRKNPQWRVPESIKKEYKEKGKHIPDVVKAGPENPLGDYAMNLSIPEYLIHGTNDPIGVGLRISHGCIRMYPEDIKQLFKLSRVGTPVSIVNEIYKVGFDGDDLYLEAHKPLKEAKSDRYNEFAKLKQTLHQSPYNQYIIDWAAVEDAKDNSRGIPVKIGSKYGA